MIVKRCEFLTETEAFEFISELPNDEDIIHLGDINNNGKYCFDKLFAVEPKYNKNEIEIIGSHSFAGVINKTIAERNNEFVELLKTAVARLEFGAKRKAIGKDGTQKYIETQERIYFRKYQIATNEIPDTGGLIEAEAADFGFNFTDYKTLIITKYEAGKTLFEMLTAMIEYARSKALLFVETDNLPKAQEVLHYMNEVEVSNTIEELTEVLTAIKNL